MFRLQLYLILKSDWSGAWLLLPIVTRTVNSIVSAGYSRKLLLLLIIIINFNDIEKPKVAHESCNTNILMRFKWNLFSKCRRFRDSLSALL